MIGDAVSRTKVTRHSDGDQTTEKLDFSAFAMPRQSKTGRAPVDVSACAERLAGPAANCGGAVVGRLDVVVTLS